MDTLALKNLGLNEKEAMVYLALLELGQSQIFEISRKSAIKRTTVYTILEKLKEKGLISSVMKGKRILYSAADPRKLQQEARDRVETIERLMPELLSITNLIEKKPKVRFYEGIEGIEEVYKDALNYTNQEMVAWVSQYAWHALTKEFEDYYIPRRVKNKVWVRAIAPDTPETRLYKERDQVQLRKTKLVDNHLFPIDVEIDLYGKDKISIMAFEEKIGLIIESRKIYNTLKSIFEMNWKMEDQKIKEREDDRYFA
jgi:HTH-type transcriptional regulator, sugar sensing transcriptional regulator